MRCISACLVLVLAAFTGFVSIAWSQDAYTIGPRDVLSISVWERPDLTRTVTVRESGEITYPPLGTIVVAGSSAEELAQTLERRLLDVLRRPAEVSVEVIGFNSRWIMVSGAVSSPGRMGFETLPNLVEVLGAAGGLGPQADLTSVQILRSEGGGQVTLLADVATAMQAGTIQSLPALRVGDTIVVSPSGGGAEMGGGAVGGIGGTAYILGDVARPGPVTIGAGMDLLKVLSLSGGILPTGDMAHVKVVAQESPGEAFVATVDLERYVQRGEAHFLVQPGDAVYVPSRSRTGAAAVWGAAREVFGMSRDVLNLFLISDVLRD